MVESDTCGIKEDKPSGLKVGIQVMKKCHYLQYTKSPANFTLSKKNKTITQNMDHCLLVGSSLHRVSHLHPRQPQSRQEPRSDVADLSLLDIHLDHNKNN